MAHSLPVFQKIGVNGDSASTGHSKLINLFVAMGINSHNRKKALLLHYAGDNVFAINGILTTQETKMASMKQNKISSTISNQKQSQSFKYSNFVS